MNTDTPAKATVDVPLVMPTVQEIALIAATLARNTPDQTPDVLAESALKLYIACDLALLGLQNDALNKKNASKRILYSGFEEKELPVTRDVFFQRLLPKHRGPARELLAKKFLGDKLRQSNNRKPTLDEVEDAYNSFGPFEQMLPVGMTAYQFRKWHKLKISKIRRSAGEKSAKKKKEFFHA